VKGEEENGKERKREESGREGWDGNALRGS